MRPKPGRPDLSQYANRFDQPAAVADSALTVTWAGHLPTLWQRADPWLP